MMTYEQFLKQLRRIGRHIMLSSILVALILTNLIIIFSPTIIKNRILGAYAACAFIFLIGLAVYPSKTEE